MKEKCEDGVYETAQEFVDDMALLFDNGDLYNEVRNVRAIEQVRCFI